MKKLLVLLLTIFVAEGISAQPQLAGLTSIGGANSGGALIQYTGGDTIISTFYSLPTGGCPGCGASPYGSLVRASNGEMYGMTVYDGTYYGGTLFQYDYPTNTYTILVNFNITSSGYYPEGSLMQASNGLLYGMTSNGGANGSGTLFSYAIGSDSVIVLVNLPPSNNYTRYNSLIQAADGNLYGMSSYDGTDSSGTIFMYNITTHSYSVLYNMPHHATPFGDLLEVSPGTFYGLTYADGAHGEGTVFSFVPASSTYTVLYNFTSSTGSYPESSLILATDGLLYGTASAGGTDASGVLFSFDPTSLTYTDLHNFVDTLGGVPEGAPYQASDGLLYGMTTSGGSSNSGILYRYNTSTATFTNELSFDITNGGDPLGHLTEYILPPPISREPADIITCTSNTDTFISMGSNYTSIQWQVSSNGGVTFSNIAGATDSLYIFTANSSLSGYEYRALFTNFAGTDTSTSATLTVYGFSRDTVTSILCPGPGYTVGGHTYTTSGSYADTLQGVSIHGCDSIVTLYLTVYAPADSVFHISSCQPVTFENHTYSTSGSYSDTLAGASVHGCDSILILDLTIFQPVQNFISTSRCPGQGYTLGTTTYTTSGTYSDTFPGASSQGCDSIITLDLTVYPPAIHNITQSMCQGQVYTIGTHTYSISGTYTDTLAGAAIHGCDSIVTLYLSIYPVASSTINASICNGQPFIWNGHSYPTTGTYIDTLTGSAAHGCDSIVTLEIVANQPASRTINTSICQGQVYNVGNHTYSSGGTYIDTLTGASMSGCDSIVTLNLIVYTATSSAVSAAICLGQDYYIGTYQYSTPGTYTHTITGASVHGCDSTVTLTLTVYEPSVNNSFASICQGQSYTFGGNSYNTSGSYSDTLPGASSHGCDSINMLHLTVTDINDSISASGSALTAFQDGASYQWVTCGGSQPISGAVGQTYIATQNGNYKCVVTMGSCVDTTACIDLKSVGIEEIGAFEFDIYPNPTNGTFTLTDNYGNTLNISILNLLGDGLKEFTLSAGQGQFDISDLAAGIYMVRLSDSKQILKVVKLIKE